MNSFKSLMGVAATIWLLIGASGNLLAQEFSAAQKEVWKNVEGYLELERKQDLDAFMAYFDESYRGWPVGSPLPINKAAARELVSHEMATMKVLVQNVQPAAIEIHGNVAFADYYLSQTTKDIEGKEKSVSERWTDIWLKNVDKWLLIGDHGGETPSNP